jgi:hypothetical protein
MTAILKEMAASVSSGVEDRLLREYGAAFVTAATPPPVIIFADSAEVESFQSGLSRARATLGAYEIELQSAALEALMLAASELAERGRSLTARAADSGKRSYEETLGLWNRNVARGLEKWEAEGRLSSARAEAIARLPVIEQVAAILYMEESEQLYFGTFFDRSILYSVAAPGASHHLSMLAFDVAEYQDEATERALARHGWFRTVINDLPHFTFLGHREESLPEIGLIRVSREYEGAIYSFWVPDPGLFA